jgi:hypothetical protein
MHVQVCIDCVDPYALAAFYAAAGLGYVVEDNTERVRQVEAMGLLSDEDKVERDGRLFFRGLAACADLTGKAPRLLLQSVPEGKVVKNRVHLDFGFQGDDEARDRVIERMVSLGGTRLWEGQQGPAHAWVTMADPEGNELCVSN